MAAERVSRFLRGDGVLGVVALREDFLRLDGIFTTGDLTFFKTTIGVLLSTFLRAEGGVFAGTEGVFFEPALVVFFGVFF